MKPSSKTPPQAAFQLLKNCRNHERETEHKVKQQLVSKGSGNEQLYNQTVLQNQQSTPMSLSTTTCPYSINQLKEEMETLHISTTNALQQAWNETKNLSVKCTFQAQEIESLKKQLEDTKKNEEKWKQKCKELNSQMIIMLEKVKPKSWYLNRLMIPSTSLSSRISFTSYLKKDKNDHFSRSECGMNSSLRSQNSSSTRSSTPEEQVNNPKSLNTDLFPEYTLRNKHHVPQDSIKNEEIKEECCHRDIHIHMNSSSEQPTKEHLHESINTFKMKLDARDDEIASLEVVIAENLKLIHLLRSEIDSRNDNVFENIGTGTHNLDYVSANKQTIST